MVASCTGEAESAGRNCRRHFNLSLPTVPPAPTVRYQNILHTPNQVRTLELTNNPCSNALCIVYPL